MHFGKNFKFPPKFEISNFICKSLELIFKQAMKNGSVPSEWKKENVVPIHTKNDKQCLKNYCPVSLLPICGKINFY